MDHFVSALREDASGTGTTLLSVHVLWVTGPLVLRGAVVGDGLLLTFNRCIQSAPVRSKQWEHYPRFTRIHKWGSRGIVGKGHDEGTDSVVP